MRHDAPLVLIVDDDEQIRDLLRTRLELDGLHTVCANDGIEGMISLTSHRPAAMLLDVSMPRMDGFQMLEALKRTRRIPPPTLMLTARNAAEDVRRAISLGLRTIWPSRSTTSCCCGASAACCARRLRRCKRRPNIRGATSSTCSAARLPTGQSDARV